MIFGPPKVDEPADDDPLEQQLRERSKVMQRADEVLGDFYYADDLARGRVRDRRHVHR